MGAPRASRTRGGAVAAEEAKQMDALSEACKGPHLHQDMAGELRDLLKGRQSRDRRPLMASLCGRLTQGQVETHIGESVSSTEWAAAWRHCLYPSISKAVEKIVIGRKGVSQERLKGICDYLGAPRKVQ